MLTGNDGRRKNARCKNTAAEWYPWAAGCSACGCSARNYVGFNFAALMELVKHTYTTVITSATRVTRQRSFFSVPYIQRLWECKFELNGGVGILLKAQTSLNTVPKLSMLLHT